jgi:hypothetical protein
VNLILFCSQSSPFFVRSLWLGVAFLGGVVVCVLIDAFSKEGEVDAHSYAPLRAALFSSLFFSLFFWSFFFLGHFDHSWLTGSYIPWHMIRDCFKRYHKLRLLSTIPVSAHSSPGRRANSPLAASNQDPYQQCARYHGFTRKEKGMNDFNAADGK